MITHYDTPSWTPSRLPKLRDQTARKLADPAVEMGPYAGIATRLVRSL